MLCKHGAAIAKTLFNSVLATNAKHGTIRATKKKVNTIQAIVSMRMQFHIIIISSDLSDGTISYAALFSFPRPNEIYSKSLLHIKSSGYLNLIRV